MTFCFHIQGFCFLQVIMKNFDKEKIAKKVTNYCFQVFYLLLFYI